MVLRPDQERVRTLLQDTITLLCRNGLSYKNEFNIKALIGITLDQDEVFLVDIKETIKNAPDKENDSEDDNIEDNGSVLDSPTRKRRKRQRSRKRSHGGGASDLESAASDSVPGTPSNNRVKAEDEESNDAIIIKDEPDYDTNYGNNQDINLSQAQLFPASQDSLQWDPQALSAAQFQSIASSQQQQMNTSLSSLSTASASISSPLQQQQQFLWHRPTPLPTARRGRPKGSIQPRAYTKHPKQQFKCTECGKSFTSQLGLKYHRDRHFGKYPYTCPYCQKGIHATINLKSHIRKEHGGAGIGFDCIYCSTEFHHVLKLTEHLESCPNRPAAKEQQSSMAASGSSGLSGAEGVAKTRVITPDEPPQTHDGQIYITVMKDADARKPEPAANDDESRNSMDELTPQMFAISNVCGGLEAAGSIVGGTGEMMLASEVNNENENEAAE